jgi:glycosyltransferase involved in cell wall biosynthesis
MTAASITVVVPAFNGSPVILDALASVRAAIGGQSVELLVVDDCSTDDTRDVVRSSNFDALLLALPKNVGEAPARNYGLAHSGRPIVTFLDQDDVILPDHFEVLEETRARLHVDACSPRSISFCTALDHPMGARCDVEVPPGQPILEALESARRTWVSGNGTIVDYERAIDGGVSNTVFAPRDLLISAGGFAPLLRGTGDYLLLCNLARVGTLAKAGIPTYGYRIHSAASTYQYDMARNILLCRAALAAASQRSRLGTAWDVELLAGLIRSQMRSGGGVRDALALGRLLRLLPRQWAGVVRRAARRGS